jgi:hypothetical protein
MREAPPQKELNEPFYPGGILTPTNSDESLDAPKRTRFLFK